MAGEFLGTHERLVNHTLGHICAADVWSTGIFLYDYEVAHFRDESLQDVVNRIMYTLSQSDARVGQDVAYANNWFEGREMCIDEYRQYLIKNLKVMEALGVGTVNWDLVEEFYPNADLVEVDLERDRTDGSFYKALAERDFDAATRDEYSFWLLVPGNYQKLTEVVEELGLSRQ